MARPIPVGAVHRSCPMCGHNFRRPLTEAEFRNDFRIHVETSEKHKRITCGKAYRMKRDMDLFRALLLKVEEQPFGGQHRSIEIPGHSKDELIYHAQLAQDAGFIEATFLLSDDFVVHRLTFAGHEFLDAAREEKLWNKAKHTVLSSTGTLTVEALKIALSMLMQQAARGMLA